MSTTPPPPPPSPTQPLDEDDPVRQSSINHGVQHTSDPPPARSMSTFSTSDDKTDTCRICRSEATDSEPLFHPCKCSGSIKHVHQECLMEWLSHSHKKHCELCKTPFRFTKLYNPDMPDTLPWIVFARRAGLHGMWMVGRLGRGILAGVVWLVILPWLVRWAWRWIFWIADVGWARQSFLSEMRQGALESAGLPSNATLLEKTTSDGPAAYSFVLDLLGISQDPANTATMDDATVFQPAHTSLVGDSSLLSSWTYLSELTSSSRANRIILDVFEGQLIACVVIVGFILVFLIREWVVQQQPLVILDPVNNAHQQLRELVERAETENARMRRQQDLLEQARRKVQELQAESQTLPRDREHASSSFMGWEAVEELMDHATVSLGNRGDEARQTFEFGVHAVFRQIRFAASADVPSKVSEKLGKYTVDERRQWEEVFSGEFEKLSAQLEEFPSGSEAPSALQEPLAGTEEDGQHENSSEGSSQVNAEGEERKRPQKSDRDVSSRATQIQRFLEEAEAIFALQEITLARAVMAQSTGAPADKQAPDLEGKSKGVPDRATISESPEELPITNAGPDAKINIKRRGVKAHKQRERRRKPPPEALRRIEDRAIRRLEREIADEDSASTEATHGGSAGADEDSMRASEVAGDDQTAGAAEETPTNNGSAAPNNNPFHPDGPVPREVTTAASRSTIGRDIASDVLGLDDPEQIDEFHRAGNAARPTIGTQNPPAEATQNDEQALRAPHPAQNMLQRIVDWFWGDITVPGAGGLEVALPANEERLPQAAAQVAPFVPIIEAAPVPPAAPAAPAADFHHPAQDAELAAAALAAGLDAEAVEDAEDLEGIFELIGLQGPILGLFQTSTFCTVLVTTTILGAAGLPYIWGKLMLSVIGDPVWFLVKMPLLTVGFIGDFLVDFTLLLCGWTVVGVTLATDMLMSALGSWVTVFRQARVARWVGDFAMATATKSGSRLQHLFLTQAPIEEEIIGWNWAFLGANVHAHASLRELQGEVGAVMHWAGQGVTQVVETISSGSVIATCRQAVLAMTHITDLLPYARSTLELLKQYTSVITSSLGLLKTGSLSFETPIVPLDPTLIYWSTTDRTLAILIGYTSLALLAALYVALDTPITRGDAGRKTEKQIRDSLRQAGGVLKVILIISIEMLVFPFYCGLLLDLAFLPLFEGASVASRWAFAVRLPSLFCFLHWFVGTCYMFHFALFVGMCRKALRKGTLWFIRDPDDPTFHPVRDVLDRNVMTQLRKIAFSALVYGGLVILCLGGVIWTMGKMFGEIFPIRWLSTEPVFEFPLDLLLYNAVTPLLIRLFRPSETVSGMYAWWLRRCARGLRLSHFMFGVRREEEEGHVLHQSWESFVLRWTPGSDEISAGAAQDDTSFEASPVAAEDSESSETAGSLRFVKDGKLVFTPCSDSYRPPKAGEAFLQSGDTLMPTVDGSMAEVDEYICDASGKKNEHFARVYIPPLFRTRVTLFMVCLWIFSAFTGLCTTLVPLACGRRLFQAFMPEAMQAGRINDIYAYTVGAYILVAALYAGLKGRKALRYLRASTPKIDVRAWTAPLGRYAMRTMKCFYVYGFVALVLPTLFALILQFYLILPLHTYAVSLESVSVDQAAAAPSLNSTLSTSILTTLTNVTNLTAPTPSLSQSSLPALASHTIHILQDYCLGLLYVRIASRLVISAPTSRAAEAFRRITAEGYLNPNLRLATRFMIAPLSLIAALLLLAPPAAAGVAITVLRNSTETVAGLLSEEVGTKMYRYSYPVTAAVGVLLVCASELGEATSRWRARIRDEVYLVGERLHNFGEKRPPVGTRSVMRRER
ncbi:hypothetical protein LTR62_008278 [Meristemomyces frigidus]|uniref:RING-type E3 ubiquitin transferase n=1 Tax=Meristemomyces frigidus TaxID=1508187 RepID=A0AAN7YCX3_9PEZI|nr:hypothetical protein LTR62_008278 [Meristemomyces frigidus]